MQPLHKHWSIHATSKAVRIILSAFATLLLLACSLPTLAQSKPNRIQEAIDSIKKAYDNEEQDYITDGQRVVWVKSYKRWTPSDFLTIKKEAPDVLRFFYKAIEHQRMDVLEQLLPTYYRYHGGVMAFVQDIKKTR